MSNEHDDFEDSDLSDADNLDSGDHPDLTDKEPNETHSSGMEAAGNSGSGYFKMYASELFPYAQWTGGSNIHASIGRNARVPVSMAEQGNLILKSMVRSEFFQYIQRVMNKHCPGMEWLITPEDFENLLLLDAHRQINGLPTTETKARLQNPQTGNYFHRVTMLEDKNVVGGIRIWIESASNYGEPATNIGFRYRLERIIPEGEETQEEAALKIRQRTAHTIVEVNEEIVEIKELIETEQGEPVMIPEYVQEKDF
jgi:hypothetical protein